MLVLYTDQLAEILEQVGITVKIFACDVKVYVRITSRINIAKLQIALGIISHWAEEWQMKLHVEKCLVPNLHTFIISSLLSVLEV